MPDGDEAREGENSASEPPPEDASRDPGATPVEIPGEEPFQADEPEEREIAAKAARTHSDFLGLMGHLYRGEMSRTTAWRARLDRTSNWAVVLVASLITFAFSSSNPHEIVLLGIVVVSLFLLIEARRYRMFDVWRSRVRMLEENVFANVLEPSGAEHERWRALLSRDLRIPKIKISLLEAIARRLRRIYLALLAILLAAWFAHLSLNAGTAWLLVPEAQIWMLPGELVVAIVAVYYALLFALAAWPMEREAKGELHYEPENHEWKEKRTNGPD